MTPLTFNDLLRYAAGLSDAEREDLAYYVRCAIPPVALDLAAVWLRKTGRLA